MKITRTKRVLSMAISGVLLVGLMVFSIVNSS
jgi:hypothetical protein